MTGIQAAPTASCTCGSVPPAKGAELVAARGALASVDGRIRAGGIEQDVAFEAPAPQVAASITAARHAKYDRYGPSTVRTVVSAQAVASTLRSVPRAG
jgi:hypothetical protein